MDYWVLEKYIPAPGKTIGIWPNDWSYYWVDKYKNYYGFSELLVTWPTNNSMTETIQRINDAIAVGYSKENNLMYCNPWPVYTWTSLNEFRNFAYYYTDEPLEHGSSVSYLVNSSIYISSYNPSSKYIVGSSAGRYSISGITYDYLSFLNQTSNTYISFTAYEGGPFNNVCDQSENWTFLKDHYGDSNVIFQWIHLDRDYDAPFPLDCDIEYRTLFSSANALGLNKLWLFANGSIHFERLDTFCLDAFLTGWLNWFQRKWIYTYKCINQNPCDCDPYTLGGEWILVSKYATWETRTVSH